MLEKLGVRAVVKYENFRVGDIVAGRSWSDALLKGEQGEITAITQVQLDNERGVIFTIRLTVTNLVDVGTLISVRDASTLMLVP